MYCILFLKNQIINLVHLVASVASLYWEKYFNISKFHIFFSILVIIINIELISMSIKGLPYPPDGRLKFSNDAFPKWNTPQPVSGFDPEFVWSYKAFFIINCSLMTLDNRSLDCVPKIFWMMYCWEQNSYPSLVKQKKKNIATGEKYRHIWKLVFCQGFT